MRERWLIFSLLWLALGVTLLIVFRGQRANERSTPAVREYADSAALLRRQRILRSTPAAKRAAAAASSSTMVEARDIERPTAASMQSSEVLFGDGQCDQARDSVRTAIERQREPEEGALWANVQSSWAQAERESDNVRRLLQADGMPSWRPDLTKLPPQRPANASMDRLLEYVPVGGHAWLAFGNAGVTEMLMNWVHHVIGLGMGWQFVVAAFDVPLLLELHARRIPAYNYSGALPATHFRHAPHLFHRMGFLKAELIVHVLKTGRHALVSDSDVAWVRSPLPVLEELLSRGATIGASTDCLDAASDADKTERRRSAYLCGHNPGNAYRHDITFNTGVVWFKADESAIDFAREWALGTLALDDPMSDDQGVFNRLMVRDFVPVVRHSIDGRVVRGRNGLRIAPLPTDRFCSGHMVWVQQAAQVRKCHSVHATFTEYGDAGKRWRFLEAGLWGLLPSEYYTAGRYLTFTPPPPQPDPQPCLPGQGAYVVGQTPDPCGGEDPNHGLRPYPPGSGIMGHEAYKRSTRLRANMELMGRQVHALRDALAIARVLNRTLILPHYDCICDRSEDVQLIPTCVHHGAPPSLQVPFKCSQHFVADTHKLQLMALEPTRFGMQPHKFNGAFTAPLPLRAHSFLGDPRTSPAIREGVVDVAVGGVAAGASGRGGATLPKGATNVAVLRALESFREARVLRLSDAQGAFSGWESNHLQARLFQTMMEYYLLRGAWCCSSRGHGNEDGRVYTATPPPLRIPPSG